MGLGWHAISGIVLLLGQLGQTLPLPDRLTITQEGAAIAQVKRAEYELPPGGLPFVDVDRLEHLTDKLDKLVNRPPADAGLDAGMGIVPERMGYRLDRRQFAERFMRFMAEGASNGLEAPQKAIYPRVDSEMLLTLKEKQIGQYTTYFNSNNKSRTNNIVLAAKAINNQYVFPDETFSFNQRVGYRSAAKGYTRAKIIVRGEVSEGIGGGICQISSTLFNAVDRAGLEILQRYSHSRNVTYVPPGRDATVSWYGPDFVFRNKYNMPVLVRATVYGGAVSVTLYSAETIALKKRSVPSASKRLPEEVPADRGVHLPNRFDSPGGAGGSRGMNSSAS
ncbi:VanW family protein [Cohnella suwonensis]|uniref:VanW family protein n=1 Tax=Cohnella suwonensis TaxID=696072 RepID=A0ABW0LYY7_9BACL